MKHKYWLEAVLLCGVMQSATAQSILKNKDEKELSLLLNEVVVTGTGTEHYLKDAPVQTEVLTGKALEQYQARSIDDPTPRDTAYLSAGTADLLYLSVRLALCELTCPADDPCPLVLDDTLVNFDDARAGRAMALFREIAQHRQVILFTCHERDCPAQA